MALWALPTGPKASGFCAMKIVHLIPLLFAASSLAGSDSDKRPSGSDSLTVTTAAVDEKTALANFKNDIESTAKWAEEKQKTAGADPAAGIAMVGELVAKFTGIRTDGLPEDLKAAWAEMTGVMKAFGDLFKGMPKMDPAKPDEAVKAFGELMPKMMALQTKAEPIAKKLEEVGKKYGLDLKKVGPGGN